MSQSLAPPQMLKAMGSVGGVVMLDGDTTANGAEGRDGPRLEPARVKAAAGAGHAAQRPQALVGSELGPYGRCCQTRLLKQRQQMSLVESQTF